MSKLILDNYGGSFQLRVKDAQDLEKIQALNDTHWAATSIPVGSLNCDAAFTSYIDTDNNGRIRTNELKAAVAWLLRHLVNRRHLSEGIDVLSLSDIDTSHPEGKRLKASAEIILANLNLPGARDISLAEVRDVQNIMASAANNGDGIIPPQAVPDPGLAQFIYAVMDAVGSVPDAGGKPGIGKEQLEDFFNEVKNYLAWMSKVTIPKGQDTTKVML